MGVCDCACCFADTEVVAAPSGRWGDAAAGVCPIQAGTRLLTLGPDVLRPGRQLELGVPVGRDKVLLRKWCTHAWRRRWRGGRWRGGRGVSRPPAHCCASPPRIAWAAVWQTSLAPPVRAQCCSPSCPPAALPPSPSALPYQPSSCPSAPPALLHSCALSLTAVTPAPSLRPLRPQGLLPQAQRTTRGCCLGRSPKQVTKAVTLGCFQALCGVWCVGGWGSRR